MAEVVAGVQARRAAAFLNGPVAGVVEPPVAGVGGKQAAEEADRGL